MLSVGGASRVICKVDLNDGETVVVKKLHERPRKDENQYNSVASFVDEFRVDIETLEKTRHKNIMKLLCCCNANGHKLLTYEYMPNGSLADQLHCKNNKTLDWPTRFNIALDAAESSSYLHNDSVPPIVHRDVKSNHIQLDDAFRAKILDFDATKVIKMVNNSVQYMSVIIGSCEYIAPEHSYTLRMNKKSNMDNFGIVVLELVTRKPPISSKYGDTDLSAWVWTTWDSKDISNVVDPNMDSRFRQHICKVLSIGLVYTSYLPINCPLMHNIVNMLQEYSAAYLDALLENYS